MMRPPKLIVVLLALILGASGVGASLAACPHNARAVRVAAHALHSCCRALHSHEHSHSAPHDETSVRASHAASGVWATDARGHVQLDGDCAASRERSAPQVASLGVGNSPCADCCKGSAVVQPRALTAAGAEKLKQVDDARAARLLHADASTVSLHAPFAPTQHAPPAPRARLHILIGVLLI